MAGNTWTNGARRAERIETLELLGMVVAHLNHAEASGDLSPRIPTLMAVRDKLAAGLREGQ